MNNQVDVGVPPRQFRRSETADVYFHNFDRLSMAHGDFVDSADFTLIGHVWSLYIYPRGDFASDRGFVSLGMRNKSNREIEADYYISMWNKHGQDTGHFMKGNKLFSPRDDTDGYDDITDSDFAERSDLLNALDEGTLVINVRIRRGNWRTPGNNIPTDLFVPQNPLVKNILNRFNDEDTSDVAFEVVDCIQTGKDSKKAKKQVTVFAHRLIVEDGSSTLAEMIRAAGEDNPSIQISDVKANVFQHMIYYIYGGEISKEDMEANAKDIIDAADKYGIVNLKLEAEASYVKSTTFTVDNIIDNILYAESKNCALLKEAGMDFLVENRDEIIGKISFDNVPGSMMTDLLTAMPRAPESNNGNNDLAHYNSMKVGTLRRMLHEKGLDVDGSREAMIQLLKQSAVED